MVNVNRFIGAEAEVGGGLGVKQTLTINDVAFADMESPNSLAYNGNVVYNPGGSDRSADPVRDRRHWRADTVRSRRTGTARIDDQPDVCPRTWAAGCAEPELILGALEHARANPESLT